MNEVVAINPKPALTAGHRPTAIVPTSMDEAYRLAKAVVQSGLAPRGLETPEKAMVAILAGLEVGLTPMAALQRIAVVNGRTTIWGDGAIGLVRASGLLVAMDEHIEGEGDQRVASCQVHRKGEKNPVTRTFTVAQAKQAGLWNKSGPWKEYPERMLQMRARAFALRDVFADVLGGLYIREEIEEGPRREPPPPPPAAKEPPAPPAPAVEAEDTSFVELATDAPALPDAKSPDDIVEDYRLELDEAKSADDVDRINDAYLAAVQALPIDHRTEALRIRSAANERFGG